MKKLFTIEKLSSAVFYFAILIFIIGFNFTDSPPPFGWYQQFMPNLNGRPISDITFTDSLNGYAVTPYTVNDSAYIVKTISGGDNWYIVFRQPTNIVGGFNRIQFINLSTGYTCGNFLWKTTNAGLNWFNVNTSGIFPMNMYVLNSDTIWLTDDNSLVGGVFRTTNGGANWNQQLSLGNLNPDHIYMFNGRIGFISRVNSGAPYVRKTTNGGQNWDTLINGEGFVDMHFLDSQTGWKSYSTMQKTTNGGLNWINQTLPQGGIIISSKVNSFLNINSDTIWGCGGFVIYPNSQARSIIYRTINGGNNWQFQIPDTSIHSGEYNNIEFIGSLKGWSYWSSSGIHTITGGDTIFYTGTKQISLNIPNDFKLFQNHPNPFNISTRIVFQVKQTANSKLIVYDITGKEITILADKVFEAGTYEITFDGTNYSSGIYFYSLFIENKIKDTKKMILIK